MDNSSKFLDAVEQSLRIEYYRGGQNKAFPLHSTENYPHALFSQIIDGNAYLQIKNESPVVLKKGCAMILPAKIPYKRIDEEYNPKTFRWSHLNIYVFGGVDFFSLVPCPYLVNKKMGEKVGAINMALADTLSSFTLKSVLRRKVLCFELLEIILSVVNTNHFSNNILEAHTRLAPAFKFMQENIRHSVTHQELADKVYLSPSRFHALFKNLTGQAPMNYLYDMRLKQAQIFLMEEGTTIAEVGRNCGFKDQFHFSRQFKKAFGQSPMQYRKECIAHLKSLNN